MSGRGDGVISRDQEGALLCLRTEKGCAPLFRFDAYAGADKDDSDARCSCCLDQFPCLLK